MTETSPGADPHDPDMAPGDEAPPDAPGTGQDVCPRCGGDGRAGDSECPECAGTGRVERAVGGG